MKAISMAPGREILASSGSTAERYSRSFRKSMADCEGWGGPLSSNICAAGVMKRDRTSYRSITLGHHFCLSVGPLRVASLATVDNRPLKTPSTSDMAMFRHLTIFCVEYFKFGGLLWKYGSLHHWQRILRLRFRKGDCARTISRVWRRL